MTNWRAVAIIVVVLPLSWWCMMAVHEAGHVLAAWATGGRVTAVSLNPRRFSYTEVVPNPRPLLVAWAGAVAGSVLPVGMWGVWAWQQWWGRQLLRFFAGFCLIANGAYLGFGWIDGVGDAGDLLAHGANVWHLVAFGVTAGILGLWLWHGLGRRFGLPGSND
ncbi:MAG: M50 family metallopeptidase [Phycisphaeraceae bacterium]